MGESVISANTETSLSLSLFLIHSPPVQSPLAPLAAVISHLHLQLSISLQLQPKKVERER